MHLLGHHLADHKLLRVRDGSIPTSSSSSSSSSSSFRDTRHPADVQIALTSFHGISDYTSSRILARLQINTSLRVSDLTEGQVSSLSAYLSSPSLSSVPETPVGLPGSSRGTAEFVDPKGGRSRVERVDPLDDLKIETDLRRSVRDDLAHHRQVGSYRGRR